MIRALFACSILALGVSPPAWSQSGRPLASRQHPNIVLIVADDLGYADVGCYGSQSNSTPAIDALARAGIRFTDFHSAGAMCTPTRASMLTGLYPQRFGRRFDHPLSGKEDRDQGLPSEAVTIAELFQAAGYATGCFGKWHLGYVPPWLPPSQGFDTFVGLAAGDGDHHTHVDRWGHPDWWHGNRNVREVGYTADLLTQHCVEFIEAHQDEPFFVYLPHLAIHFPWQGPSDPPHRQVGHDYTDDKWGRIPNPSNVSPHVKAMVESVDRSVASVIDALQRCRLLRDTVVVFTSDNGGYLNYGERFQRISNNGPFRGQKATMYEGGHRVPMIVAWPGRIAPNESAAIGHSTDLLPTLAELARIDLGGHPFDGVSLASHLEDSVPVETRTLFWRMGSEWAVRRGRWKQCGDGRQRELYDLQTDQGERHDLSGVWPNLCEALTEAWSAWETRMESSSK